MPDNEIESLLRILIEKVDSVASGMGEIRQDISILKARDAEHERNIARFWDTEWRVIVERNASLEKEVAELKEGHAVSRALEAERQRQARLSGAGAGTVTGIIAAIAAKLLG